MTIDQYELVDRFGQACNDGVASLLVGAGLSMAAGLPGWERLLTELAQRANVPATLSDLPLVADYIEHEPSVGRGALERHLAVQLIGVGEPTEGHRLVAELPVREIWTTNYDQLLELAMPDGHVVTRDDDAQLAGTNGRSIIKMHGSLPTSRGEPWPTPPVITRGDYERYATDHPRTWTRLRATYLTTTMLFLGFSFTDPNIEVLLRLARLAGTASKDRHLTVLRRPTDEGELRLHDLRVADLERSGIAVHEIQDFTLLAPLLRAVLRRSQPPRCFIAGSGDALEPWSAAMAEKIAPRHDWQLASLGGPAGWQTTRRVAGLRRAEGTYAPENLLLYFRRLGNASAPPLDERAGTAIYSDLQREPLVASVLDQCRAMLVLGGSDRTSEEVQWARERGIGIVPIAATGGAAYAAWLHDSGPLLGGRPVEERFWQQLADEDVGVATAAAMRLLEQAMYRT